MEELWKKIDDGNDSVYEVSTDGRVRNSKTGRILRGRLNRNNGYYRVNLRGKDEYIHRLVLKTFVPNDNYRKYIRHIDRNKQNNSLSNLEWIDG